MGVQISLRALRRSRKFGASGASDPAVSSNYDTYGWRWRWRAGGRGGARVDAGARGVYIHLY